MKLDFGLAGYAPLQGSSYVKLPKGLEDKKAIVNVHWTTRMKLKCFMWSVLSAVHPVNRKDQPHRLQHYKGYEQELNFSGIEFPMK